MTRDRGGRHPVASALFGMLAVAVVAGVLIAVAVTPAIAMTGAGAKGGIGLFESLPADLKIAPLDQKTEIYAKRDGKNVRIASFYTQDREVVKWGAISETAKHAAVAAEDVRFYEHGGVDPLGIARAAISNVLGENLQGASTITQQYVKNVCVQEAEQLADQKAVQAAYADCTDSSVGRKLREARAAIALEKRYSKDEILLGYLNIAGFGGRVYGIESAARYYFDTTAAKLTVAQAASLMAIVNDPQALRLDVAGNIAANTVRRDYILGVELRNRLITKAQYTEAVATTTKPTITKTVSGCQTAGVAGFFCDYVVHDILNNAQFGRTEADRLANLQSAGWKIYTTLDLGLEQQAQAAMDASVPKQSSLFAIGGAAVSVEVGTGRIVTMVQNKDYDASGGGGPTATAVNYNADSAYGASNGFQPGSTFKLFTLLQWLKTGHTLDDVVNANPGTFPASSFTACGKPYEGHDWQVSNDTTDEGGFTTVADATARSINGAFASMAQQVDLCDVQRLAESFGVWPANGDRDPTMYLPFVIGGSYGVSPLAMASAYATIANGGISCSPVAIDRVVRTNGSTVQVPSTSCKRVIGEQVALAAASALRGVFTGGTASGDQTADGLYEFGKTGTTDEAVQTWMIGTTSKVTTAVWVGNNGTQQNLRQTDLNYCAAGYGATAAVARHCVWKAIQTAVNAEYGGATTWQQPEQQYVSGDPELPTAGAAPDAAGTVPDVSGTSAEAAGTALVQAGYSWTVGDPIASSLPAGQVASTEPAAGTAAPAGTQIVLHESTG